VPNQVFLPDTIYHVKLENVESAVSLKKPQVLTYNFTTQSLPGIKSVNPAHGTTKLLPETDIKINLTTPNLDLARFEFLFSPEIKFTQTINDSLDQYVLSPDQPLAQATKYNLKINRVFVVRDKASQKEIFEGEPETVYEGTFEIAAPSKIEAVSPTGDHVLVNEDIAITFSDAMNADSLRQNFSITPAIGGSISVSDDKKILTFTPSVNFNYDTSYEVKLAAGTKNEAGGFLEQDEKFSFKTIGHVYVVYTSPQDKAVSAGVQNTIKMTFDQDVGQASAESKFSISPSVAGDFSWTDLTLSFKPKNQLDYNANYQVKIASGIKSVDGLDSVQDFSFGFTTEEEVVKINGFSQQRSQRY
jgi:hypothetical protein